MIKNHTSRCSSYKCTFLLIIQSVHAPNGLILNMFGPIEGGRHDDVMLGVSGIMDNLRRIQQTNGEPYVIYGDPAYGVTDNILASFRGVDLTVAQKEFNKRMSKVRVSVEWGFGKITQYFAFLDFRKSLKSQKILLQPIAKYYLVGSLLTNCHTC